MNISEQIKGMEAYGASNPMRRDDYRRPMREAMLRYVRAVALFEAGAPAAVLATLQTKRLADWPSQARRTCFPPAKLTLCLANQDGDVILEDATLDTLEQAAIDGETIVVRRVAS